MKAKRSKTMGRRGQKNKDAGFTPPAKYDEPKRGNKTKSASARNKRLERASL